MGVGRLDHVGIIPLAGIGHIGEADQPVGVGPAFFVGGRYPLVFSSDLLYYFIKDNFDTNRLFSFFGGFRLR
jgi:hypothetical protein